MALTADRNTRAKRLGDIAVFKVAASVKIYNGALVAINATGYLAPAANTAAFITMGRAEQFVDNTAGADGALTCRVQTGVFEWANSGGSAVDQSMIGKPVFCEDDQTVGKVESQSIKAGIALEIDPVTAGVWVKTDPTGGI